MSGIVETGFTVNHLWRHDDWCTVHNVMLPANGPLTEEKGTADTKVTRNAYMLETCWYPCYSPQHRWQPALRSLGQHYVLNVAFITRQECEDFIERSVFSADTQLGTPVMRTFFPDEDDDEDESVRLPDISSMKTASDIVRAARAFVAATDRIQAANQELQEWVDDHPGEVPLDLYHVLMKMSDAVSALEL